MEEECVTYLALYISDIRMVKTIRVPDEYHEWLKVHNQEGETMGDTLRRLTQAPPPVEAALTDDQAADMREAIEHLRASDRERLSHVAARLDEADLDRDPE